MSVIRVFSIDDHFIAQEGLCLLLELDDDIKVVGRANCADAKTLQQVRDVSPDVVIMDIQMGPINGLEATRLLSAQGFPILVLSMYDNYLEEAIQAGATGYLVKDAGREELVSAVGQVSGGGFAFGSSIMKPLHARLDKICA